MIRKWEWIREYCKRQGFEKSAEIADQIDRVLCYLYGDVNAVGWEVRIRGAWDGIKETGEVDLNAEGVRRDIASDGGSCIACEREDVVKVIYSCDFCEFGRLTGECNDEGSLFMEFVDKYREESE